MCDEDINNLKNNLKNYTPKSDQTQSICMRKKACSAFSFLICGWKVAYSNIYCHLIIKSVHD